MTRKLKKRLVLAEAEVQSARNFGEQLAQTRWLDMGSHYEVRGPVGLMLDSEFYESEIERAHKTKESRLSTVRES